ncbi:MFS transporter [Streptococcus phocae subsp. salmonis]|uniref:MFS transporter n=1 Tax=Streptococcus phocae TaxID=119224 RepID=UPI0005316967|nr:MFS transporter [Streptococcus phocae]KGR73356.1 hypothetical protein NX86_00750 [Streptococcus phocae subsp. salmonis]
MKANLEKLSILSLSFILVSSFSISPALPEMLHFYDKHSPAQVEVLVSLPSFAIMLTLLLSGPVTRLVSDRAVIISGLGLASWAGVFPVFSQVYEVVFVSRFLLGVGIGLINARAIALISERYQGQTRVRLLGYRGSVEVFGSAFLTVLAGQLLRFGWSYAFLTYGCGFISLLLYVWFVQPTLEPSSLASERSSASKAGMTRAQHMLVGGFLILAIETVLINASIYLRLPLLMLGLGHVSNQQTSLVLGGQQLIGILAGVCFAWLLARLKTWLAPIVEFGFALSLAGLALSASVAGFVLSAILSGFFFGIKITLVFNALAEGLPGHLLNRATAITLLGCSFSAFSSPFVLRGLDELSGSSYRSFFAYSLVSLTYGAILLGLAIRRRKKASF